MENEISVTVKGKNLSDVAQQMVAMGQTLNAIGTNEDVAPKKVRGKKAKAEEPEEVEEDVEETVEDLDEEMEEDDAEEVEDDDDAEETEEDEEPAKIDAKQLVQLKKALNSYSTKHGKPKAVKILHKFAKVSQDVKTDDFAKILKALKV